MCCVINKSIYLPSEGKRQQEVCQECWKRADSHSESYFLLFFSPPPRNSFSMKSPFARAVSYGGKGKYFNNNTGNVDPIYGQQKPENSSVSAKISQHPWKMLRILQLSKLKPFKHIPLSISKRLYSTHVYL